MVWTVSIWQSATHHPATISLNPDVPANQRRVFLLRQDRSVAGAEFVILEGAIITLAAFHGHGLLQSRPAFGLLFRFFSGPCARQCPIMKLPRPQPTEGYSDQWMSNEVVNQLPEELHAGTFAMSLAYVRRLPTMASMNESSRSSVWRFTSPSLSLQVNSSTYRNRCLGEA